MNITFADVIHQTISFSKENPQEKIILDLLDNKWVQRLRDISQTANTRLVYMCSEHSRFGHSLGAAYLAKLLLDKLRINYPEVGEYYQAVLSAALLHDIGHIAPGSHTAFKTWFPDEKDAHEEVAVRIIREDPSLNKIFSAYGDTLAEITAKIIEESAELPPWCWQIVSGGGWNVDRGNWCMLDSILAGVSYGKYNISALLESVIISKDKNLALKENRLDAMMHFAVSRHAMYRQVYQHRVLLAADCLNKAIVSRARDLDEGEIFCDQAMLAALRAKKPGELNLENIYCMREAWWRYHLLRWTESKDQTLSDLSERLLNRRLFKTIRINNKEEKDSLIDQASLLLNQICLNPKYYLHEVSTQDVHASDSKQSMLVQMDNNEVLQIGEADPLFNTLVNETKASQKSWLVIPHEIKQALGKVR